MKGKGSEINAENHTWTFRKIYEIVLFTAKSCL